MATANSLLIESAVPDDSLARYSAWQPQWMVDVGDECKVGLAVDDGCFVVLYPHGDSWRPGTHVPKAAAEQIARLLREGVID